MNFRNFIFVLNNAFSLDKKERHVLRTRLRPGTGAGGPPQTSARFAEHRRIFCRNCGNFPERNCREDTLILVVRVRGYLQSLFKMYSRNSEKSDQAIQIHVGFLRIVVSIENRGDSLASIWNKRGKQDIFWRFGTFVVFPAGFDEISSGVQLKKQKM